MTESAAPRCLKLIAAPQGQNKGGMSRETPGCWPGLRGFCLMLALFSLFLAPVAHFCDFLACLKSSCVFFAIFCDFGSIFGGFGRLLGRILGGFFDVLEQFS